MASVTGISYDPYQGAPEGNLLAGDLDATFTPVEDDRTLLWETLAILTTPQGNLFWAPTATMDLPGQLNATLSSAQISALQARAESLFDGDPRMNVAVTITFDSPSGALDATVRVQSSGTGRAYEARFAADGTLELV